MTNKSFAVTIDFLHYFCIKMRNCQDDPDNFHMSIEWRREDENVIKSKSTEYKDNITKQVE